MKVKNHRGLSFFFLQEKGLRSETVIFVLSRKYVTVSRVVALVPDIPVSLGFLLSNSTRAYPSTRRYHQLATSNSIRKETNRSLFARIRSLARSSSSFPANSLWWRQSHRAYDPYIIGSLSSRQSTSQTIFIIMNCNAYPAVRTKDKRSLLITVWDAACCRDRCLHLWDKKIICYRKVTVLSSRLYVA